MYVADLSRYGGGIERDRPCVIVQNDVGNRASSETIVLAIRDRHGGRMLPVFVPVAAGVGGLRKASIVDAGHICTVPAGAMRGPIGQLPATCMSEVDRVLKLSLALT